MPSGMGGNRPLLLAQGGFKRDVQAVMRAAVEQMGGVLNTLAPNPSASASGRGGNAPALARIGQTVSDVFTGRDNRSGYGADGVTPLAPYPRMLNKWLAFAVFQAVKQQQDWLRKHTPPDVFNYLRSGKRKLRLVSEQEGLPPGLKKIADELGLFAPDPLAEIDPNRRWIPPHKWTDERGYRLSDRVWRTDMETRARIDELLTRGLADGRGALELSKALEAYLIPNERGRRTLTPYGRRFQPDGAAFSAMRLARTEITRAFNQAAYTAGYVNPYTEAVEYVRSGSGDPTCPICPQHATLGMGGERLRPPYPKNGADMPPAHPHCMCYLMWTMTDSSETVTARLRAMMQQSQEELNINPADARAFTDELLGPWWREAWFDRPMPGTAEPPIRVVIPPIPAQQIAMPYGMVGRDVGTPGTTVDSLNAFMQSSDGPLARALKALADFERGMRPLELDWDSDQYTIDGTALRGAARLFVAEARNTQYTRAYLADVVASLARENGVNVTGQGAIDLYNREYQYQAQAILTLAQVNNTRLTDAQRRWLNAAADGRYYELTSAPERASARAAELDTRNRAGQFGTQAARDEFRTNFLRMLNDRA